MIETWLTEILWGIARLFLNPLLYILFLFSWILGYRRVKRERRDFNIRIHSSFLGIADLVSPGIVVGLFLSVLIVGLGLVIPNGFIVLTAIVTFTLLLTLQTRWLSPANIIGLSILVALVVPNLSIQNEQFSTLMSEISTVPLQFFAVILSLLLVVEGFFILKKGANHTSPVMKKSKRGKPIGAHEARKLWMVPLLVLIPGEGLSSFVDWWPVLQTPHETYSLLVVPFAIGFQQQVQAALPKDTIQLTGRRVLVLSLLVTALTVGAYWLPFLAIIAAVIAIIGRELINVIQKMSDDDHVSYFASRNLGMVILGIIPDSPAEKMAILVGETITRVNGQQVRSEKEFYEALQINRAFCKLEVLDYNGEVRFVQRALYDGEHHELGLLFIQDNKEWTNEAV